MYAVSCFTRKGTRDLLHSLECHVTLTAVLIGFNIPLVSLHQPAFANPVSHSSCDTGGSRPMNAYDLSVTNTERFTRSSMSLWFASFQPLSTRDLASLLHTFVVRAALTHSLTVVSPSSFCRPSKPPQPVDSEAPSATPPQPHAVPSPLVRQLPQQELSDQPAESDPRPRPRAQ